MKPVLTIYLKGPVSAARQVEQLNMIPKELKDDYHVIILQADRTEVTIVIPNEEEIKYSPKMETRGGK